MQFTERSVRPPEPTPAPAPSANPYPIGSGHKAIALYWAQELLTAIDAANANPEPTTIEDLEMNHVVRCATRMAYHAGRVLDGKGRR